MLYAVAAGLILLAVIAVLQMVLLVRRPAEPDLSELEAQMMALGRSVDTIGQIAERSRAALADESRATREELARLLRQAEAGLQAQLGEGLQRQESGLARAKQELNSRLDSFTQTTLQSLTALRAEMTSHLGEGRQESAGAAARLSGQLEAALQNFNAAFTSVMTQLGEAQQTRLNELRASLDKSIETSQGKLEAVRQTVDAKLQQMQTDNANRLEQMRLTVEEKLQGTLETRLGESFRTVSERLEQVHKGLGEMQQLAEGVGDLKRVMTNVKTRGTWGEVQLATLLEQMLSPAQYEKNVATGASSSHVVEFAVKLPGRREEADEPVWLPIDSKFPTEDYQRMLDAQDRADPVALEAAGKQLEARIRASAKDIHDKYLNPPKTTDFGILFLPTEGLYAEVVRRMALVESLQRDLRIVVAGPTTLTALLSSLQMGFRTLAVEKRSSEVWKVLGAVKTEFGKFGGLLENVKKSLDQASNKIDTAASKSRTIERRLRSVEALPEAQAENLLGLDASALALAASAGDEGEE